MQHNVPRVHCYNYVPILLTDIGVAPKHEVNNKQLPNKIPPEHSLSFP